MSVNITCKILRFIIMKTKEWIKRNLTIFGVILFIGNGCCADKVTSNKQSHSTPSITPSTNATPMSTPFVQNLNQSDYRTIDGNDSININCKINGINFCRFTYPATKSIAEALGAKVKINGEDQLFKRKDKSIRYYIGIDYCLPDEITGGGKTQDVIVVLGQSTGGSGYWSSIYIYSFNKSTPKLLWKFETGDRANGGLRDIYGENNNLVVETYNELEHEGTCCPSTYTKSTYKWNKNKFQLLSAEKKNNPSGSASPEYMLKKR